MVQTWIELNLENKTHMWPGPLIEDALDETWWWFSVSGCVTEQKHMGPCYMKSHSCAVLCIYRRKLLSNQQHQQGGRHLVSITDLIALVVCFLFPAFWQTSVSLQLPVIWRSSHSESVQMGQSQVKSISQWAHIKWYCLNDSTELVAVK